jgi:hypothetical protein
MVLLDRYEVPIESFSFTLFSYSDCRVLSTVAIVVYLGKQQAYVIQVLCKCVIFG